MSGGHFNHNQWMMADIADEIEYIIENNGKEDEEYGNPTNYSDEVIATFKEATELIRKAHKIVNHVDYFLSGDTGEETYLERMKQ